MKVFKIKKKSGKFRTIYAPDPEEKAALRNRLGGFEEYLKKQKFSDVQHGFRDGRNPVTNALCHVGYEFSLSMDLEDFFDSVTPKHVPQTLMSPFGFDMCFPEGAARQGLPTSPALSNIAALKMDEEILSLQGKGRFGKLFVYTRYADDLTFSYDFKFVGKMLKEKVSEIAQRHGFKVNESKTKFQAAKAGRRIICGVAVDARGVYPTRAIKRKLRAAKHQGNNWEAKGLGEWMKLKLPNSFKKPAQVADNKQVANNVKNDLTKKPILATNELVSFERIRKFNFNE